MPNNTTELTEEMIKKIETDIADWLDFDYHNNEMSKKLLSLNFSEYEEIAELLAPRIVKELTTALEEQKQQYQENVYNHDKRVRAAERTKTIESVLELLVDEEENEHSGHEIDDFYCIQCGEHIGEGEQHPMETFGRNELRAELRDKLKAMKGKQ